MQQRRLLWMTLAAVLVTVIVVGLTLLLGPELEPAFDVAVTFVNAAGRGDEAAALPLLSDELRAYVAENCPEGRVSACVAAYTPEAWGAFSNAVFRRSRPEGPDIWHVLLVATYEEGQGFSGVCVYNRLERSGDSWRIVAWSGFVSCDAPDAGLDGLAVPGAANRAP